MAELPDDLVDLLFEVGRHGQLQRQDVGRRIRTTSRKWSGVERPDLEIGVLAPDMTAK